jgi:hypothetical protein
LCDALFELLEHETVLVGEPGLCRGFRLAPTAVLVFPMLGAS